MKNFLAACLACFVASTSTSASAQTTGYNLAMNAPDLQAWKLFIMVNKTAGGTNATFETWASDTDTFVPNPTFPQAATPLKLKAPAVFAAGQLSIQQGGGLLPAVPPDPGSGEETRRNKAAFDFIVQNNLHKVSGLKASFGRTLSFPIDSVEVKANWIPVAAVPAFSKNRVTLQDVPKTFHVNTGADGKQYALVSMHVISKFVPNWTWATFEHWMNPARCDILGCRDSFGAQTNFVSPNPQANQGYPNCVKSAALSQMLGAAQLDPTFSNYCLKGSQVDFIDNTGLATRVGNSVTERGFVQRSSCLTCHSRAGWDSNGIATSSAGFDPGGIAPIGSPLPSWFWAFTGTPPIFQGAAGLKRTATSADFVWSIPFCAIDDSASPPAPSNCLGR